MQAQCNVFEGASGEIALTAAGGLRQIPGLTETFENAALVTSYGIIDLTHFINLFHWLYVILKITFEINVDDNRNG
jgi:hypothetical protein